MEPHDRRDTPSTDHLEDHAHSVRLDDDEPVAMSIVYAVAGALGSQPLDLEPLSTQVDPEALETLLSGPIGEREALRISFAFAGCTVVLTPSQIRVLPDGSADN